MAFFRKGLNYERDMNERTILRSMGLLDDSDGEGEDARGDIDVDASRGVEIDLDAAPPVDAPVEGIHLNAVIPLWPSPILTCCLFSPRFPWHCCGWCGQEIDPLEAYFATRNPQARCTYGGFSFAPLFFPALF